VLNIRHILYPVDFSERCAAILPLVKAMAARHRAKVTLLHALQVPSTFYPAMETAYVIESDIPEMTAEAEEKLASFYGVSLHPLPAGVEVIVATAEPARCIVESAEALKVDLIMLPTHGYGRYRALLLGSIAAKVLHDAKCTVWTAAHTEEPILAEHAKCQIMLCGLDLNPGSKELLLKAIEFAASCGAQLRIVHAVPGADRLAASYMGSVTEPDFRHFLLQAAREEIERLQRDAGTQLDVCVKGGSVSKVMKAAVEQLQADLAIIGRGKLDATLGRLRTHAYSIIRDSPCPVISL
jgi:nucleotide-binding universal stress UspA family protein